MSQIASSPRYECQTRPMQLGSNEADQLLTDTRFIRRVSAELSASATIFRNALTVSNSCLTGADRRQNCRSRNLVRVSDIRTVPALRSG